MVPCGRRPGSGAHADRDAGVASGSGIREEARGSSVPMVSDGEERPVYVARRLADAQRLEAVLTAAGIEYDVEPQTYQGGVVFRSTRVGAFFYVAPEWRDRAAAVMLESGFT